MTSHPHLADAWAAAVVGTLPPAMPPNDKAALLIGWADDTRLGAADLPADIDPQTAAGLLITAATRFANDWRLTQATAAE